MFIANSLNLAGGKIQMAPDSVFSRRVQLAKCLDEGALDMSVVKIVLPNGEPIQDEDLYWDYKESLPWMPEAPTDDQKSEYAAKMAEVVKDVVAFHNTYGGYLIVGVRDSDYRVVGHSKPFDENDLAKKILGATRVSIDVKYRSHVLPDVEGSPAVGVLMIPKRSRSSDPVQFLKDAVQSKNGRKAFQSNDIYMRSREECRPARTASDYALLFNREQLGADVRSVEFKFLENNIPAKDPNLINFVGREAQLDSLWKWFTDKYTAVKLLSGPGGVGKTSIAWTFCDAVSRNAPAGLEKIVWLTAKKKTYAALLGEMVDIAHTHFSDLDTLLVAILAELGVPENQLPEDASRDELIEECIEAVKAWPCLLVVDDIDSLPTEGQFDVFRTISTIFDRVIASGAHRARALLTARLNLSAAPGQLMQISGLSLPEFIEYVEQCAEAIGAPLAKSQSTRLSEIKQLYKASSGSPLFAASVLRLVGMGESLSKAVSQYQGADGQEVRKFAFERELESLIDRQLRILYAALHLKDPSIDELVEATHSNRAVVRDDIAALRNYHLMSIDSRMSAMSSDDVIVSVPAEIRWMSDLIRRKINDPNRIEKNCAKINRGIGGGDRERSRLFNDVVRLWSEDDYRKAVEVAEFGSKRYAKEPDVWCLLARAYLKLDPPNALKADAALRKAEELGCARPELLPLRIEAKELLSDWIGIVQVLENKSDSLSAVEVISFARALGAVANDQILSGNYVTAENYFLRGAKLIFETFKRNMAYGYVEPLKALKHDLGISYFGAVRRRIARDDDKIDVWNAYNSIYKLEIWHRSSMDIAAISLGEWWQAVKRRDRRDPVAERICRDALLALNSMIEKIEGRMGWERVLFRMVRIREELEI